MKPYAEKRPCSKCGSLMVGTRHADSPSRMVRKCERCGYVWTEAPLDQEPEA